MHSCVEHGPTRVFTYYQMLLLIHLEEEELENLSNIARSTYISLAERKDKLDYKGIYDISFKDSNQTQQSIHKFKEYMAHSSKFQRCPTYFDCKSKDRFRQLQSVKTCYQIQYFK